MLSLSIVHALNEACFAFLRIFGCFCLVYLDKMGFLWYVCLLYFLKNDEKCVDFSGIFSDSPPKYACSINLR